MRDERLAHIDAASIQKAHRSSRDKCRGDDDVRVRRYPRKQLGCRLGHVAIRFGRPKKRNVSKHVRPIPKEKVHEFEKWETLVDGWKKGFGTTMGYKLKAPELREGSKGQNAITGCAGSGFYGHSSRDTAATPERSTTNQRQIRDESTAQTGDAFPSVKKKIP